LYGPQYLIIPVFSLLLLCTSFTDWASGVNLFLPYYSTPKQPKFFMAGAVELGFFLVCGFGFSLNKGDKSNFKIPKKTLRS
jgi:hypothetical protein